MPEKLKPRALSASRQRRQITRRSSLTTDSNALPSSSTAIYSGVDLRTTKQKIEDLEKDFLESKHEATSEQILNHLVLMQVYSSIEYGDISIENSRAYLNLSKYYLNRKINFLPQAKFHALNARQIFEQLNIKPTNENHLTENLLGYDIYFILSKCSLNAQKYLLQRDIKIKNKHILSIDKTHIDHDLKLIKKYLEKLKDLIDINDYERYHMEYLFLKLDVILMDLKDFYSPIENLIDDIVNYIEKYFINDQIKRKIDLYLRCASYLINFDDNIQDGLKYYRKAVELADEQEKSQPSNQHKLQLANAILQRNIAKVRTDHLTDDIHKDFQRTIQLYQQPTGEINKNVLKTIDELATYYTKLQKYQDALNVLCESLPDKIRLYGDFSEEVIQTESRIGAIYLREGECLNAAEHLKTCLDLQQFVYGPNDPRTCQTRDSVEILKKDPMVSRSFFARTQDGKRQNRPVFRTPHKISHEQEDYQLLQTVTKKPPLSSKT